MFDELSPEHPRINMGDIVTLRVRTGKDERFTYDSETHVISSKKGLHISRFLAGRAMKQNALEWNPTSGEVVNATIYIEEDVGTSEETPSEALKAEDIEALKDTDGLGDDTILIDGRPVKKRTIDFKNKYDKKLQKFTENNLL